MLRRLISAFPLAVVATILIIAPSAAQKVDIPASTFRLDPTHASLTWKVRHFGLSNYTARFAKFDATLTLDPANVAATKLTVTVDPTSIRTDYPNVAKVDFDKELSMGEKWFNAGKFPTITFTSTKVEPGADNSAKVTGDLTLLGVTKPVTLDVKLIGALAQHPMAKKPVVGFTATGSIKRTEFGMTNLVGPVGDDVTLQIEAELIAQ